MGETTRAPREGQADSNGFGLGEGLRMLWNPARLAERVNQRRVEAGKLPAPDAAKAAVKQGWNAWRSTSIIRPDGTREQIIINSRSEQLKIVLRLVQIAVFVLAVAFSNTIFEYIGERMAGNSGAVAKGVAREWGRQLGF